MGDQAQTLTRRYREAYENANGCSIFGITQVGDKIYFRPEGCNPQHVMTVDEAEAAIIRLNEYVARRSRQQAAISGLFS